MPLLSESAHNRTQTGVELGPAFGAAGSLSGIGPFLRVASISGSLAAQLAATAFIVPCLGAELRSNRADQPRLERLTGNAPHSGGLARRGLSLSDPHLG